MKTFGAAVLLLVCALATSGHAEESRPSRTGRDLRYRPNVAYAYQYRTDHFVAAPKVAPIVPAVVPVVASVHLQNQLLRQVKPVQAVQPVPHFPTRRPMQALDRLHTRVDIGHQHSAVRAAVHPTASAHGGVHGPAGGTIVAHSHTEFYRKYA